MLGEVVTGRSRAEQLDVESMAQPRECASDLAGRGKRRHVSIERPWAAGS